MQVMVSTILLAALLGQSSAPVEAKIVKLNFAESLRKESKTVEEDFNTTLTQTASKGKTSLSLTLNGDFSGLNKESLLSLKVGSFELVQKLGDDFNLTLSPGKAQLKQYIDPKSNIKTQASVIKLDWTKDKLNLKFEGEAPYSKTMLLEELMEQKQGSVSSDVEVSGKIGSAVYKTTMTVTGKIDFKTASAPGISGSVWVGSVKAKL
jgi:hypothetical protein